MNTLFLNIKFKRMLAHILGVVIILTMVFPATWVVHATTDSPFTGKWEATDVDGSAIRLTIAGRPEGPFQITWTESYISFCNREAGIIRGIGWLNESDANILEADLHLECFTTGATLDFHLAWRYHPSTNTLSSRWNGVVTIWRQPGGQTQEPPTLYLRVNYGHDWVESFYEGVHTVWVTVTDSDGNVKATAETITDSDGYFQTPSSNWLDADGNPMAYPPDIQPGDWVYGWVDNGASAQLEIGDISGTIDLAADSIQGTVSAPWYSGEVGIECHSWGAPLPEEILKYDSVQANGEDIYSCAWPGEWDIQPGQDVGVAYFGPDGHWVANVFSARSPLFRIFPEWEYIDGSDWTEGTTVSASVSGKPECAASDVVGPREWNPDTTFIAMNFREGCDVETGDTVTVTDGVTTRTHTVHSLAITEIDKISDTVTGIAGANTVMHVGAPNYEFKLTTDDNGAWLADFGSVGVDIVEGTCIRAEVRDEVNGFWTSATAIENCVPTPHFSIFPEWDYIEAWDWPDGATLRALVDGKPECTLDATSGHPDWDPKALFASFWLPEACDVIVGDQVTVGDGVDSRTYTVQNLTITAVDPLTDTISGTADPGVSIHVWPHGYNELLPTADENGVWLANFRSINIDLVDGMAGRTEIRDELGNATAVEWVVPATLVVSSMEDAIANDGFCTLREAIIAANTNSASGELSGECPAGLDSATDTILLSAGRTYSLTIDSTNEDGALDGDLDIWDNAAATDLVILVEGNGNATISQDASVDDRVLENHGAAVQMEGLTLIGGDNVDLGGGVYNKGSLTLESSKIKTNVANRGGGVFNDFGGTLMLAESIVANNTANIDGGGVWNFGNLIVNASKISANSTTYNGGGLFNYKGTALIENDSVIGGDRSLEEGNIANLGGGMTIWSGSVFLNASTVSGNSVSWDGGGVRIAEEGNLTINLSAISDNSADHSGGGLINSGKLNVDSGTFNNNMALWGGGLYNLGNLEMNASTIRANTAIGDGGSIGDGGGFYNGGTFLVNDSRISDNMAAWGGGIINYASLNIQASTLNGNSASQGGGGILAWNGTLVIEDSTLISNMALGEGDAVYSGVVVANGVRVTASCIVGNGITAVFNNQPVSQDFTSNWWGDASGPSGAGPGTGDSVSDYMDFSNWLTEPPSICTP